MAQDSHLAEPEPIPAEGETLVGRMRLMDMGVHHDLCRINRQPGRNVFSTCRILCRRDGQRKCHSKGRAAIALHGDGPLQLLGERAYQLHA
jgi:hypothetical protein